MQDDVTEGVIRALDRAEIRAVRDRSGQIDPVHLLLALADEEESRAATLLSRFGLASPELLKSFGSNPLDELEVSGEPRSQTLRLSPESRTVLQDAIARARTLDRTSAAGTEHILQALLEVPGSLVDRLEDAGLRVGDLLADLSDREAAANEPLPLPADLDPLDLFTPSNATDIWRVLDASANRAREGLRVVEDYVRFALDDPMLTKRLKDIRHRLDEAVRGFDFDLLIASRDTTGDVGTHIMAGDEGTRENPRAVVSANFKRCAEALRSLEEYAKLINAWIAGRFEVLRYDLYTVEKLVITAITAHRSFDDVRLYVLVGGQATLGDLTWVVGEALAGGAQAIQLREKGLPDREILKRAREVRILTAQAGARFVLNDRPDLARLSGADGVHLGQEDMTPRDARRVLGPKAVLGVSTHDREQLEAAVIDGAGYLGVGPIFPSTTKMFDEHVGLGFVRAAAESTSLPWYAIGGIGEANLDEVLEAGASRIAVNSAVVLAERPRVAAKALRQRLDAAL